MSRLQVERGGFTGAFAGLNGHSVESINLPQFVWAALSFGPQYFASSAMHHAVMLACYKVFAIDLAVEFRRTGITRRDTYALFDPSEKGNVSFWLGMSMATWMAQRYLGVSHLHHAESLRQRGLLDTNRGGHSLADFVGFDSQKRPHIIEAKGRQAKPGTKERRKFKRQAATIRRVDGTQVATRSYSIAWGETRIKACLIDPPPVDNDSVDILFPEGRDAAIRAYDDPWLPFLDDQGTRDAEVLGVPVRLRRTGSMPVSEVSLWVGRRSDMKYDHQVPEMALQLTEAAGDDTVAVVGPNGIVCVLARGRELQEVLR